ncbi:MAG: hypothetical protein [Bacteriophage sp.]|nr:MAG: hypothetical protein [Bacteriophage sp.]
MSDANVHVVARGAGRPLTYTDDIPDRLTDFFDKDYNDFIVHNFTTAMKSNYRVLPIPTLAGFCRELGIAPSTLHRWMSTESALTDTQRNQLCNAYSRARALQENIVTQIGVMTNGTFAAFMLKCNFGWRDNTEVKTDENVKPIRVKIVSERPVDIEIEDGGQAPVEWGDD